MNYPAPQQSLDIRVERDVPGRGWWTFIGLTPVGKNYLQSLVEEGISGAWNGTSAYLEEADADYFAYACALWRVHMEYIDHDGSSITIEPRWIIDHDGLLSWESSRA